MLPPGVMRKTDGPSLKHLPLPVVLIKKFVDYFWVGIDIKLMPQVSECFMRFLGYFHSNIVVLTIHLTKCKTWKYIISLTLCRV